LQRVADDVFGKIKLPVKDVISGNPPRVDSIGGSHCSAPIANLVLFEIGERVFAERWWARARRPEASKRYPGTKETHRNRSFRMIRSNWPTESR
jgi:hypothetical protein